MYYFCNNNLKFKKTGKVKNEGKVKKTGKVKNDPAL